jgi:tetratricopeptide (TPR) repeat protein
MPTEPPNPSEAPDPSARSWHVRLLNRLGVALPASWPAAKADFIGKIAVNVTTAVILAAIFWLSGLGGKVADLAWRRTVDYVTGLPKADPAAPMSILVARLAGDDGKQTERVRVSLRRAFAASQSGQGIQVLEAQRELQRGNSGDDARDQAAAEAEGRRWLSETGATILVWGEIAAKDKVLRLYFVRNAKQASQSLRESYVLNERLELARDFQEDLGLVVAGHVTALAAPASETSRFVGGLLDDLQIRLAAIRRQMMQGPMAGTPSACEVTFALAAVLLAISEQGGAAGRLNEAIEHYRFVSGDKACANDPELSAMAANNLGVGLKSLGQRDGTAAPLEEAAAAFQAVAEKFTRERAPRQWAMARANLGAVLQMLGQRNRDPARVEESITAFRDALGELTRERAPLEWATAQANLAVALQTAGLRNNDTAQMKEAIAAYVAALQEFTEKTPIPFATIQHNVGLLLFDLGERETGTERLEQAAGMLQSAIEVFEDAKAGPSAQVARQSLARVEALLAERRKQK